MTVVAVKPIVRTRSQSNGRGRIIAYGRCSACDALLAANASAWARNGLTCACGARSYYNAHAWKGVSIEDESTFDINKYIDPPTKRKTGRARNKRGLVYAAEGGITGTHLAPEPETDKHTFNNSKYGVAVARLSPDAVKEAVTQSICQFDRARSGVTLDNAAHPLYARLDRLTDAIERIATAVEIAFRTRS